MAWTTPMTATPGQFDAADFNTHVRDNLLMSEAAQVSVPGGGGWLVSDGANSIVPRKVTEASVIPSNTTTFATYVDLGTPGPSVTVETGAFVIVIWSAENEVAAGTGARACAVDISGDTTIAASDATSILGSGVTAGDVNQWSCAQAFTVNPGTNTFKLMYRSNGTAVSTWRNRRITVWSW